MPLGTVWSILKRETKTEKSDTHSIGVIYVSVAISSTKETPGASDTVSYTHLTLPTKA